MEPAAGYASDTLSELVSARFLPDVNGLRMHTLEAGLDPDRPCVILLHGFPEIAYSWRKIIGPLARAGYHVVAPDQRGFGRTTGWDGSYDGRLESYRMVNRVRDIIGLVDALGRDSVAAVIGHDAGSPVAAWCALLRPDLFRAAVLMSAPFGGPPELSSEGEIDIEEMNKALGRLPQPRKHYQWYYSTRSANHNMLNCPQGVHDFLRAYFHYKSADWGGNDPQPLQDWTANRLANLPSYYVMDRHKGMAETVAPYMPSERHIRSCRWLTDKELRVYSSEYKRTGFQGGLQWYRCGINPRYRRCLQVFGDRTLDVPSAFIAGQRDWGVYQTPGIFERMQNTDCTDMRLCTLVEDAGHWVQQEAPERVTELLIGFLDDTKDSTQN
jgi:pimeloyl-ACP methyl ester carboxylesterase